MKKNVKKMTASDKIAIVALAILFFPVTIVLVGIILFLKAAIH